MTLRKPWTIGFDADDTLWHNERFFRMTQDRFAELLADYAARPHLEEALLAAERRNLGRYGFGIKGFVLSMIETAIEVTDQRVPAPVIAELLAAGREMLAHPVELLPHAREAVEALAGRAELVLITKGDLLHQEQKLAQSGLGDLFDAVEIVSDKTPATYHRVFARHAGGAPDAPAGDADAPAGATGTGPRASRAGRDRRAPRAMMVGNSLKSDVMPAIEAGAWGVHVPHGDTWALEHALPPRDHPHFREIVTLGELPQLVEDLS